MKSFKVYLKEEISVERNLHISHAEDLPITEGQDGLKKALSLFKNVINQLSGVSGKAVQIKTKFDGAPSLISGINPENGEFFVGTKGVFNKLDPKINYTEKDINKNHEGAGLRKKLKVALKYLPELGMDSIYQGDMMFTHDDLQKKKIDGESYVTFKANTITYAVRADSELAKEIMAAKMGIIFHTKYTGTAMANLKSSLKIDISDFKPSKNVWYRDADFEAKEKKLSVSKGDIQLLKKDFNDIVNMSKSLDKTLLDKFENDSDLQTVLMGFNNFLVRKNEYFKKNSQEKYDTLVEYIKDKFTGEVSLRKSDSGKERRTKKYKYLLDILEENKDSFLKFFQLQNDMIKLKQEIINKLNQVKSISTFVEKDGQLSPAEPEGFVTVSDDGGVVKLIDRDQYSRLNFNLPKDWK
jgi:hypothetical protein